MTELSFIVPAWNEADDLPRCLAAIHDAAGSAGIAYEIVVADDASTDGTGEIARSSGARVVRAEHRQISATRNSGARASTGRYLLFVDADTLVTPAAVLGALDALRGGAACGGGEVAWDEPLDWRYRIGLRFGMLALRLTRTAPGAFLFCTREAFDTAGGFDETVFAGEEIFFSRALRKTGRFAWVREPFVTSARKIRTHGFWELMRMTAMVCLGGFGALRSRKRLGLWYERRPDPGPRREEAA